MITTEQQEIYTELREKAEKARDLGFAVVIYFPDEIRDWNPDKLEDALVEYGNEIINQ